MLFSGANCTAWLSPEGLNPLKCFSLQFKQITVSWSSNRYFVYWDLLSFPSLRVPWVLLWVSFQHRGHLLYKGCVLLLVIIFFCHLIFDKVTFYSINVRIILTELVKVEKKNMWYFHWLFSNIVLFFTKSSCFRQLAVFFFFSGKMNSLHLLQIAGLFCFGCFC